MIYAVLLTICITCAIVGGILWFIAYFIDIDNLWFDTIAIALPIFSIISGAICGMVAICNALV